MNTCYNLYKLDVINSSQFHLLRSRSSPAHVDAVLCEWNRVRVLKGTGSMTTLARYHSTQEEPVMAEGFNTKSFSFNL